MTSTENSSEGESRIEKKGRANALAAVPVVGGMNVDGVHTGSCGCIRCAGLAVSLPQMGVLRANSVTLPWEIERCALAFLSLLDVAIMFYLSKSSRRMVQRFFFQLKKLHVEYDKEDRNRRLAALSLARHCRSRWERSRNAWARFARTYVTFLK